MAGECPSFKEAFEAFQEDPRKACKYGGKCYQRNPVHLEKYKHPPKRFSIGGQRYYPNKKPKNDGPDGKTCSADENVSGDSFNDQVNECSSSLKASHNVALKITSINNSLSEGTIIKEYTIEAPELVASLEPSDIEELDEEIEFEVKTGPAHPEDSDASTHDGSNKTDAKDEHTSHYVREFIKQVFLVEMPRDFYDFWSFCEHLSKNKPSEALSQIGLTLVGPFDVLSGKLGPGSQYTKSEYLRHWRYYYDPPEFQTVIKADDKTLFHIGYFRDDPKEMPCFVASNSAAVDCIIKPMAENIFGAVNTYLDEYHSKTNPFQKMKVSRIQASLQEWAASRKITLELNTAVMRTRSKKTVCRTFHRAGMAVPYDRRTELGYRSLIQSESNLKKMLQKVVSATTEEERDAHLGKLQEVITAANIATDECDFGTGLELALDLFSFGNEIFHNTIKQLASTAYGLLNREEFATILEAHLEDRKKGSDLSIIKK